MHVKWLKGGRRCEMNGSTGRNESASNTLAENAITPNGRNGVENDFGSHE